MESTLLSINKEEYWKKYGSKYDVELRHRWGLNPFNPRHKKQIIRRLND